MGEIRTKQLAEKNKKTLQKESVLARREKDRLDKENGLDQTGGAALPLEDTMQPEDAAKKPSPNYYTATPGLHLDVASVLRLEDRLGQGVVTERHRDAMMKAEDLAELRRLEEAGFLQAKLQQTWEKNEREQTFLAHGINHIAYDPRRWTQTLLAIRGRAPVPFLMWLVFLEAVLVFILYKAAPSGFDFPYMKSSIHSLFGVSVAFLVVFRTQAAF
jgi:hypothetical protein